MYLYTPNDSTAKLRFFFLSYLFIDRNIIFLFGGIISLSDSDGWSNAWKLGMGYRTPGLICVNEVKVSLNIPAEKNRVL
jgi:hypothetical protein